MDEIIELISDSLNYINMDESDVIENLKDSDEESLGEIKEALETLNRELFQVSS